MQPYPYRRNCDCAVVVEGHCDRDRHVVEFVCRRAPGSLPQGVQGPGMARDGPQAVPSELVCVCDPVGRYFTSVKPTLPSGATV